MTQAVVPGWKNAECRTVSNPIIGYGARTIGKASVTGYCIKFKTLQDVDLAVLRDAVQQGVALTGGKP